MQTLSMMGGAVLGAVWALRHSAALPEVLVSAFLTAWLAIGLHVIPSDPADRLIPGKTARLAWDAVERATMDQDATSARHSPTLCALPHPSQRWQT